MRIPTDHRLDGRDQPSPLAFVARVARRASDGALALYAASGLLGAALLLTRGEHWWVLLPTFVALALFGLWGMVDRSVMELRARHPAGDTAAHDARVQLLQLVRMALAVVGIVAALAAVLLPLSTSLDNVVH